jgi:hypothetical protein
MHMWAHISKQHGNLAVFPRGEMSTYVEDLLGRVRRNVTERICVVGLSTFHRKESFARLCVNLALQEASQQGKR